jgi:hypothetical protein
MFNCIPIFLCTIKSKTKNTTLSEHNLNLIVETEANLIPLTHISMISVSLVQTLQYDKIDIDMSSFCYIYCFSKEPGNKLKAYGNPSPRIRDPIVKPQFGKLTNIFIHQTANEFQVK